MPAPHPLHQEGAAASRDSASTLGIERGGEKSAASPRRCPAATRPHPAVSRSDRGPSATTSSVRSEASDSPHGLASENQFSVRAECTAHAAPFVPGEDRRRERPPRAGGTAAAPAAVPTGNAAFHPPRRPHPGHRRETMLCSVSQTVPCCHELSAFNFKSNEPAVIGGAHEITAPEFGGAILSHAEGLGGVPGTPSPCVFRRVSQLPRGTSSPARRGWGRGEGEQWAPARLGAPGVRLRQNVGLRNKAEFASGRSQVP